MEKRLLAFTLFAFVGEETIGKGGDFFEKIFLSPSFTNNLFLGGRGGRTKVVGVKGGQFFLSLTVLLGFLNKGK